MNRMLFHMFPQYELFSFHPCLHTLNIAILLVLPILPILLVPTSTTSTTGTTICPNASGQHMAVGWRGGNNVASYSVLTCQDDNGMKSHIQKHRSCDCKNPYVCKGKFGMVKIPMLLYVNIYEKTWSHIIKNIVNYHQTHGHISSTNMETSCTTIITLAYCAELLDPASSDSSISSDRKIIMC
jgi:hypothetical protein